MPGTSKAEWMHIFADQESIELSVSQYCKLHGISDKAFYNAKSRYKRATEELMLAYK
ncbi:IS66 family insertion sequence element accessory protein TnpA [Holdemanella porci]|uniref:IS66 family insertion sequence element accessory protein TnpA n=1 Tax=Holdemanella porci TaxID=2652276 RepID=UPI002FDD34F6